MRWLIVVVRALARWVSQGLGVEVEAKNNMHAVGIGEGSERDDTAPGAAAARLDRPLDRNGRHRGQGHHGPPSPLDVASPQHGARSQSPHALASIKPLGPDRLLRAQAQNARSIHGPNALIAHDAADAKPPPAAAVGEPIIPSRAVGQPPGLRSFFLVWILGRVGLVVWVLGAM